MSSNLTEGTAYCVGGCGPEIDPLHILPQTNNLTKTVDTGRGLIVAGVVGSVERNITHSACTIGTPTFGVVLTP